jgi:prophage tail gpP-like protein
MTGTLISYTGARYEMPTLFSWDMSYGLGSPCDSFEVSFLFESGMQQALDDAVRFEAKNDGETVFTGVVDEYEMLADENGRLVSVRGRGLAALLLDNEAVAAEYYPASLRIILENHVYPWGITQVRAGNLPNVQGFSVSSGQSQWGVIENYSWFCGGIMPRVTREGVLLLNGEAGNRLELTAESAICQQSFVRKRYGIISEVLVYNKSLGITSTVENSAFKARGGRCRRVITVPQTTGYDAMRHTGSYQIERSEDEEQVMTVTVPAIFAAFPGDTVVLRDSPLGMTGEYYVIRTRCRADGDDAGTEITMRKTEG